jgi:hypothetical protein
MSNIIRFDRSARIERRARRMSVRSLIARAWQTFVATVFVSYRPDRHYMRGPGPKWHLKYDRPIAQVRRRN